MLVKVTGVICVLAIGLAGCSGAAPTTPVGTPPAGRGTPRPTTQFQVTTQMNVSYGPLPDEVLDLCTPKNTTINYPGVLLLHGGGWMSSDKSSYDALCRLLAARGWVAATINYRLVPRYTWPDQLVDSQLAVRWLRSHAEQYGLDPQRLCSWGSSAGGHLAIFLGVLASLHPGDEAGLLTTQSPHVTCIVDEFGPVDLTVPLGPGAVPVLRALFGGATQESNPALYRDVSPIFDVSSQSAPALIIQGSQDQVVDPGQSQKLFQALQKHRIPVDYISYDGAPEQRAISFLVTEERP
jgi:acetyl esterase/lipase